MQIDKKGKMIITLSTDTQYIHVYSAQYRGIYLVISRNYLLEEFYRGPIAGS